jgi:hypothetical protein
MRIDIKVAAIPGRLCPPVDNQRLDCCGGSVTAYFTECHHGAENDMSGVDPSTNESSGGPAPGIPCPGAGSGIATPSIPTLQEPPPAVC